MKRVFGRILVACFVICFGVCTNMHAQSAMQNVLGREKLSLNGKWNVITDQMNVGLKKKWYAEKTYRTESPLCELYFEGGMTLNVPGDWNSQNPEFVYYEGAIWYKKSFEVSIDASKRYFLHFAAVCRDSKVYLNGKHLGDHKGGYTPFQFEVGDKLREGKNFIVVRVDNVRTPKSVPAMDFDWWSYGGITRDVDLITTPKTFIEDYHIRLEKGSMKKVLVDVTLNGTHKANQTVEVSIEGTNYYKRLQTNSEGKASIAFEANLELWSPDAPRLYDIVLQTSIDNVKNKVKDRIGFRNIEVKGADIYLNGQSIFLRGINIHEEIAQDRRRSINKEDAMFLTDKAAELGCNFIRLSHYPHNEYMVRLCEEKGFLMWEEIPVWQNIDFADPKVCENIIGMMAEMVQRDKNRCGIAMWSVANETFYGNKTRLTFLTSLIEKVRQWDNTRLITSALNGIKFKEAKDKDLTLLDPLAEHLDVIGLNKYMGWYDMWRKDPAQTKWITIKDKPVIISEFGAEAIYAQYGDGENLNAWSEDYMKQAYIDNLSSFDNIPNLRGTAPWILFDFRSPRRSHAMYQQGWNRKGLLSPEGNKKQAWYIMRDYYQKKTNK